MPISKQAMLAGAATVAGIFSFAAPAEAAVILCYVGGNAQPQCANTNVNVLVDQQTGDPVTAGDNDATTNVNYTFTSTTEALLKQVASGQADVASGDADGALQQISFNILNGAASLITFNLIPLGPQATIDDATSVTVSIAGQDPVVISGLAPNGQNFYGIVATAGEQLTGLSFGNFSPAGSGIQALNQVRLNLVPAPAVPEPGTWALMLLGFGAVGTAIRRSRRRNANTLLQMA
ncbi:hypothetical protein GGQ97_001690 [Sphingomonas kaistensis]|uniref:Ice-binding protein C-terminal domain-containing protein n=1 Tax=Sphingomonas kaistensis TaxID=298708 RepID=A0A7X5Y7D7_9SPHN|nr:PEPxxWA-CTERM sorting domain-containing protein [Sphingomonas kaistensis]NJC05897.1 hypothetical protein [Sphingomonas kaistensis]